MVVYSLGSLAKNIHVKIKPGYVFMKNIDDQAIGSGKIP